MTNRFALHAFLGSGPSYKAALILALTGTPRDYVHVDLRGGEQKTAAFLAKNRYGQVPVLEDRKHGLFISQSQLIVEHVAIAAGRFAGETEQELIRAREWTLWELDRLTKGIFRPRAVARGVMKLSGDILAHYLAEGASALAVLDSELAGRDWIVGADPTFADVDLYAVVFFADQAGHDITGLKNLSAWKSRVESLPGYGLPADVQDAPPT